MDNAQVFITGRLTQDVKVFGEDNKMRALFTVAVNRGIGDKRKASFIDCIAWGKRAQIANTLKKGNTVAVQGQLEQDVFEKTMDDGSVKKINKLKVNVDTILQGLPNTRDDNDSSSNTETVDVGSEDGVPF